MSNAADNAIAYCQAQIGKPYAWGEPPRPFTGQVYPTYDCSGLVGSGYAASGVQLGGDTYSMATNGTPITKANLLPGDLVFPDAGHVQIYIGNGQIIEAPRTGEDVRQTAMWGFSFARRVTTPGTGTVGPNADYTVDGVSVPGSFLIKGPVSATTGAVDSVTSFVSDANSFFNTITQTALWVRIAVFAAGIIAVGFAVTKLTKKVM